MYAYKFVNWYHSIKVIRWHGLAYWLDLGMSQIGIRAKRYVQEVVFPDLLVVGNITKWYQIHGFNTEPGWARKVEVEEKVSKGNCC
jgi:hypothetical protein